jgi:hypothetical protein
MFAEQYHNAAGGAWLQRTQHCLVAQLQCMVLQASCNAAQVTVGAESKWPK